MELPTKFFHEAANQAGAWKLPVIFFCGTISMVKNTFNKSCGISDISGGRGLSFLLASA
jgi:TPP-dependent pyruvate/acetoin dehydrogenase alpha subunit